MAHHTVKQGYRDLVGRINRFPQGAPPSDLLYQILKMLFSIILPWKMNLK